MTALQTHSIQTSHFYQSCYQRQVVVQWEHYAFLTNQIGDSPEARDSPPPGCKPPGRKPCQAMINRF